MTDSDLDGDAMTARLYPTQKEQVDREPQAHDGDAETAKLYPHGEGRRPRFDDADRETDRPADDDAGEDESEGVGDAALTAYRDSARELGLSDEQTQSLLQKHSERIQATHAEWAAKTKTDPQFEADGYDASVQVAREAISEFGDDELFDLVDGPLGDHPALVRFAYRVGKALRALPSRATDADLARKLYREPS